MIGLRPEALELASDGVAAKVEVVEELGADAFVFCSTEIGGEATKLVARTDVRNAPKQGEQVRLRPRADDALLFDPAAGSGWKADATRRRDPGPHNPGELFLDEIREQPAALRRLLSHGTELETVTRAIVEHAPTVVRLVGHGSSDAAASYGVYAFGLLPGWTAMRDSISLTVYYDSKVDLSSSVVIALSQSGETPDVVEYVKRARAKGALTVQSRTGRTPRLAQAADTTLASRGRARAFGCGLQDVFEHAGRVGAARRRRRRPERRNRCGSASRSPSSSKHPSRPSSAQSSPLPPPLPTSAGCT